MQSSVITDHVMVGMKVMPHRLTSNANAERQ
jgi:hypothetical protein